MEAVVSAEMFVPMLGTTWHLMPENSIVVIAMQTSNLHTFHL
jgi:hypothetical protein